VDLFETSNLTRIVLIRAEQNAVGFAPAIAAFARTNLINTVNGKEYVNIPAWFKNWEKTGLIAWVDKNNDGIVQYRCDAAFEGKPRFHEGQGAHGQRLLSNELTDCTNELFVDRDIIVLANPEIARLPNWVVGLVAAGGLAAALSTAAGLLLVISTSISHDLMKKIFVPRITEKQELLFARIAAGLAVVLAGHFGVHPPGFVAQVVAFAFGLAASSFFPVIFLGIFSKRMNKEGAISGMLTGITFTAGYIIYFKFINPSANVPQKWLFGISPEGIGAVGMVLNFVVALVVSRFTAPPPARVQALIEEIRIPKGASEAHEISA